MQKNAVRVSDVSVQKYAVSKSDARIQKSMIGKLDTGMQKREVSKFEVGIQRCIIRLGRFALVLGVAGIIILTHRWGSGEK